MPNGNHGGSQRFSLRKRTAALAGLLLTVAFITPSLADYRIVDRIKVPDGGFDYATFDSATGQVLIARTDFTTVINAKTGKVSQLNSAAPGHMALPVPGTKLIVAGELPDSPMPRRPSS